MRHLKLPVLLNESSLYFNLKHSSKFNDYINIIQVQDDKRIKLFSGCNRNLTLLSKIAFPVDNESW